MLEWLLVPVMGMLNRFAGGGALFGPLWNTGGIPTTMWNYEFFKGILDRFGIDKLPGRAFYPAIALCFLLFGFAFSWIYGFLVAATFAFWRTWAWGLFIGMGRHVPDREFTKLENFLFRLSAENYFIGFLYRNLFVLPGFILIALYTGSLLPIVMAFFVALGVTASYELSWKATETLNIGNKPLTYAEYLSGLILGLAFVLMA